MQRAWRKNIPRNFTLQLPQTPLLIDDDAIKYLHENMDNIVLSLDGRKHVNDYIRVRADGSGSYDDIVSNIKKMVAMRERDKKNIMCGAPLPGII